MTNNIHTLFHAPAPNPDVDVERIRRSPNPLAMPLSASFNRFADHLQAGHRICVPSTVPGKWYTRFATPEEIADIRTRPHKQ